MARRTLRSCVETSPRLHYSRGLVSSQGNAFVLSGGVPSILSWSRVTRPLVTHEPSWFTTPRVTRALVVHDPS